MKKFFKILMWIIIGAVFVGTFVFLYRNSAQKKNGMKLCRLRP